MSNAIGCVIMNFPRRERFSEKTSRDNGAYVYRSTCTLNCPSIDCEGPIPCTTARVIPLYIFRIALSGKETRGIVV